MFDIVKLHINDSEVTCLIVEETGDCISMTLEYRKPCFICSHYLVHLEMQFKAWYFLCFYRSI